MKLVHSFQTAGEKNQFTFMQRWFESSIKEESQTPDGKWGAHCFIICLPVTTWEYKNIPFSVQLKKKSCSFVETHHPEKCRFAASVIKNNLNTSERGCWSCWDNAELLTSTDLMFHKRGKSTTDHICSHTLIHWPLVNTGQRWLY